MRVGFDIYFSLEKLWRLDTTEKPPVLNKETHGTKESNNKYTYLKLKTHQYLLLFETINN